MQFTCGSATSFAQRSKRQNMEIFKATQTLEIEDSKEIHRLRTEIARAFQG